MAKRGSLNKESDSRARFSGISRGLSASQEKIISVLKLILGICLLPFVYSASLGFLSELSLIGSTFRNYFWLGIATFLIFYLLIWEPEIVYNIGHRLLENVFNFFEPYLNVAPDVLPSFTIILFLVFEICSIWIKQSWLAEYFIFLFGFTIIMHLVFTAKSISANKDFLKANYIFGFSLIYIINLLLLGLFLGLMFKEFSFVSLCSKTFSAAWDIFTSLFNQIILSK